VIDRAREATRLDRILVATDDERIAAVARQSGVEAVMTPSALPSGTDRVAWAVRHLGDGGRGFEVVVNLQGDEPFLPGPAIDRAVSGLETDPGAALATLAVRIGAAEAENPHVVKVVVDVRGRALYFSRQVIPHQREGAGGEPLKHVGLYAFRREGLERFVSLSPSPLERAEGLEQLRALEDGMGIAVAVGDWPARGIDTPGDLARAERDLAGTAGG
jgi:3-deoxy-manno-octulosonate cytidylyltransferase (CMP-KDO synthetase)